MKSLGAMSVEQGCTLWTGHFYTEPDSTAVLCVGGFIIVKILKSYLKFKRTRH